MCKSCRGYVQRSKSKVNSQSQAQDWSLTIMFYLSFTINHLHPDHGQVSLFPSCTIFSAVHRLTDIFISPILTHRPLTYRLQTITGIKIFANVVVQLLQGWNQLTKCPNTFLQSSASAQLQLQLQLSFKLRQLYPQLLQPPPHPTPYHPPHPTPNQKSNCESQVASTIYLICI